MNVKVESYGHALILNCRGELNADGLEAFSQEVEHHLTEQVNEVVLHCGEITFVDSAGLEYLLELQDRLAERLGQVTLTNLPESIATILQMTRLEGSFEIRADVSEAVKAI